MKKPDFSTYRKKVDTKLPTSLFEEKMNEQRALYEADLNSWWKTLDKKQKDYQLSIDKTLPLYGLKS